jgi:hypothetical protein
MGNFFLCTKQKIKNNSISNFVNQNTLVNLVIDKLNKIDVDNKDFLLYLRTFINSNKKKINIIVFETNQTHIKIFLFHFEKNQENKIRLCDFYFNKSIQNIDITLRNNMYIYDMKNIILNKMSIDVFDVNNEYILNKSI